MLEGNAFRLLGLLPKGKPAFKSIGKMACSCDREPQLPPQTLAKKSPIEDLQLKYIFLGGNLSLL